MNQPAILAASYIGPAGHGNDLSGLQPWPAHLAAAFQAGDLTEVHWSLLFTSDPARFGRMDLMSRLGLMAVERLDAGLDSLSTERRDRVGVCVETCAGSLATDVRFLQTPRASLFAYTLPSTVLGEICIRYRLRGPVLCLPTTKNCAQGVLAEAVLWLAQGDAELCLCVVCEAVDREAMAALAGAEDWALPGWHAGAVLLGKRIEDPRCYPAGPGSLIKICEGFCARLKQPPTP
jgi:3-oxoacyl-(acyl-carrier-protein) synthase